MSADAANKTPSLARRIALVLLPTFALVLCSFLLPKIALDGPLAVLAVRFSDTGYTTQMPFLCVGVIALVISRPSLTTRRRTVEGVAMLLAMIVALAGNAWINENIIKPNFAVARPNMIALTEAGALEPEIDDPAEFYALGDKSARRDYLEEKLEELDEPALAPLVRDHWAYETGYSFPSGHSTAAITFATLMAALALTWMSGWRLTVLRVAVPIWALCVVYSRVLLTVHSPVDVTVGALAGIGWGLLGFAFVRWAVGRFGVDPNG